MTEFLPQSSRVYLPDGLAPTIQATGTRSGNRAPQVLAADPRNGTVGEVFQTLKANSGSNSGTSTHDPLVIHEEPVAYQCHGNNVGPMGTLRTGNGGLTGGVPFVVEPVGFCTKESGKDAKEGTIPPIRAESGDPHMGGRTAVAYLAFDSKKDGMDASEVCPTLRSMNYSGSWLNGGGQVGVVVPIDLRQAARGESEANQRPGGSSGGSPGTGIGREGDPAYTVSERGQAVVYDQQVLHGCLDIKRGLAPHGRPSLDPIPTEFAASDHKDMKALVFDQPLVVRRMTPRECERCQGMPDDHTLVEFRGKPAADSHRYRAVGNSMAVPCMAWIGRRLLLAHAG